MSPAPEESAFLRLIQKQLGHPLKLRLLLVTTLVVLCQGVLFGPIGEQVAATTSKLDRGRKRTTTAREVEQLKKSLVPLAQLVSPSDDAHELMRRVITRIRSSPLRLVDLRPEKPGELGPYATVGLQLKLEGSFADLDDLLAWAEAEKVSLGVDSIRLGSIAKTPGRLSADLTLRVLAEKSVNTSKSEAKKKS